MVYYITSGEIVKLYFETQNLADFPTKSCPLNSLLKLPSKNNIETYNYALFHFPVVTIAIRLQSMKR